MIRGGLVQVHFSAGLVARRDRGKQGKGRGDRLVGHAGGDVTYMSNRGYPNQLKKNLLTSAETASRGHRG